MHIGYLFLLGRIIGMGLECSLVKSPGIGFDPTGVTPLYVGLGHAALQ